MKPLTDRQYWEAVHKAKAVTHSGSHSGGLIKRSIKRLLGNRMLEYVQSYPDYLLWQIIYPKYMSKEPGARVLEVGSAPGTHLVKLHRVFGFEPYGVEYTEHGVDANRRLFRLHGLEQDNVIHADFCGDEFQKKYAGFFDIVISGGFIEHFDNVDEVVSRHVSVLKPGGLLFVDIPNLRGANYYLTWFFRRELIPMHNMKIMPLQAFERLFQGKGLDTLFCDYYGTFSFGLFKTDPRSPKRYALRASWNAQLILNASFRLCFRRGRVESRFFSPYLLFIGMRKSPPGSSST